MSFLEGLILKTIETTTTYAVDSETTGEAATQSTMSSFENIGESAEKAVEEASKLVEAVQEFIPKLLSFGVKILVAVLILIVGKLIINVVMKLTTRFFDRTKIELSVKKFLISLFKAVLYVILVIIVCNEVGIDTTSFVAMLASAGLAVGLALQGSLSNFAGGVMILITKPFVVGDYIIDAGTGYEGTVQKVDLFCTHLVTVYNKMIIIPNGSLANSPITNVTAEDKRRVDVTIGISYNASISEAKKVMEQVIAQEDKILKDEQIMVFVQELAESQVTMGLRVWAKTDEYWNVLFALNENLKNAFDEAGIEIPYNQLDVHVINR